jgi:hypothetical protein
VAARPARSGSASRVRLSFSNQRPPELHSVAMCTYSLPRVRLTLVRRPAVAPSRPPADASASTTTAAASSCRSALRLYVRCHLTCSPSSSPSPSVSHSPSPSPLPSFLLSPLLIRSLHTTDGRRRDRQSAAAQRSAVQRTAGGKRDGSAAAGRQPEGTRAPLTVTVPLPRDGVVGLATWRGRL